MSSVVAICGSSMLCQGPRLRASLGLVSEVNASAGALSSQSPAKPTEATAPASADVAAGAAAVQKLNSSPSRARSVRSQRDSCQPTTRREQTS
jgi:hypothetical protein